MTTKLPLTYHPKPSVRLGQATIPRFSGGWMHQFGHIYALQKEMEKNTNSWFRAMELWHVARNEGIPYSGYNYAHILRFCNRDKQWSQALRIFSQMKTEGITLDTDCSHQVLAACVRCDKWDAALEFFQLMQKRGVKLNELCLISVIMALRKQASLNKSLTEQTGRLAVQLLADMKIQSFSNGLQKEVAGLLEELPEDSTHKAELLVLLPRANTSSESINTLSLDCP